MTRLTTLSLLVLLGLCGARAQDAACCGDGAAPATAGTAKAQVPETPAGRQLQAWIEKLNAGRPDRIRAFVRGQMIGQARKANPEEHCVKVEGDILRLYGRLHVDSFEAVSATAIRALLTNDSESHWVKAFIHVEPEAPHRIDDIDVGPGEPPAGARPGGCASPMMVDAPKVSAPKVVQGQKTLVEGRVVAKVPFEIRQGLITIPARINGSKEIPLAVDTGMSLPLTMLNHRESVQELGLKVGGRALVKGAGEGPAQEADVVLGAVIQVGALVLEGQQLTVLPGSRANSDWGMEGVIGKNLFDRYVVSIDYEAGTLTFFDPAQTTLGSGFQPIPLELTNGMPVLKGSVDTVGKGSVPVNVLMDLGNSGTLLVARLPERGLHTPDKTISGLGGVGLQGKVFADMGRVRNLSLGGHTFFDVPAHFLPGGQGCTGQADLPVNVGSQIWRRFRVVLDYPGKRLFLTPNAHYAKPFPFNMAGLSLRHEKQGTYRVAHVIPGTPAHEQGLREGDRITALDGKEVRTWTYQQVIERFSEVGEDVAVEAERGGEKVKMKLRLRQLI